MWIPPIPSGTPMAPKLKSIEGTPRAVRPGEVRRREPGRRVGADGVEGDVAEVEQPGVADDHVQADRHHREEDDRDHRVHARERLEDRDLEQRVRARSARRPRGTGRQPRCARTVSGSANLRILGRQQVEDVGDREQDHRRRMRRDAEQPGEEDHDAPRSRAAAAHARRNGLRMPARSRRALRHRGAPTPHRPTRLPGVCSPSSPCGRKTRMMMRIAKTIDSVHAGPGEMPRRVPR